MENGRKQELYTQSRHRHCLTRFKRGIRSILFNPWLLVVIAVIVYIYIALFTALYFDYTRVEFILSARIKDCLLMLTMAIGFLPMMFLLICLIGKPIQAWRVDPQMQRICIKNGIGEAPILYDFYKIPGDTVCELDFLGDGIPMSFYEDHIEEIEAAINVNIVRIEQGRSKSSVIITAVDYEKALNKKIDWLDNKILQNDFALNLGETYVGEEIVNLNLYPHILIGGSTGSGKSVCLKNIVYQCVMKGAKVYVADFKGGVDFAGRWKNLLNVITDIDDLIPVLNEIVAELQARKKLLLENDTVDIVHYNLVCNPKIQRIIFACDEVAELLDKTGLDKETKEKVSIVESRLATIARQGRAFGINLILATQRPDATILSGQIRNNIDYRICGRADDVLSKIVLDNTDASERIPKYEQGLFLTNSNTIVRGYYFDETMLQGSVKID